MFRTSYEEFPLGRVVGQTPMVVAPASAMQDYAADAHPAFRGCSRLSARRALRARCVSRETGRPGRVLPTALPASALIHARAPHAGKPLLQRTAHPGIAKTPTVCRASTQPAEADGWRLLHTSSPALPRRTHRGCTRDEHAHRMRGVSNWQRDGPPCASSDTLDVAFHVKHGLHRRGARSSPVRPEAMQHLWRDEIDAVHPRTIARRAQAAVRGGRAHDCA